MFYTFSLSVIKLQHVYQQVNFLPFIWSTFRWCPKIWILNFCQVNETAYFGKLSWLSCMLSNHKPISPFSFNKIQLVFQLNLNIFIPGLQIMCFNNCKNSNTSHLWYIYFWESLHISRKKVKCSNDSNFWYESVIIQYSVTSSSEKLLLTYSIL